MRKCQNIMKKRENVMNKELYDEAVRSNTLSKNLIAELMESMNYSSISFINWTVEVLKIIKNTTGTWR